MSEPTGAQPPRLGDLKAAAQRLEAILHIGKAGVSAAFLTALERALDDHGLVKVRFDEFKEQKKILAPEIAARTGSRLVMRVGNVAVFHRQPRKPG